MPPYYVAAPRAGLAAPANKHIAKLVAAIWLAAGSSSAWWEPAEPAPGGGPAVGRPLPADSCQLPVCQRCPSLHVTCHIAMGPLRVNQELGLTLARQKGAAGYSWRLLELRAGALWVLRRRALRGRKAVGSGSCGQAVGGKGLPAPAAKSTLSAVAGTTRGRNGAAVAGIALPGGDGL